jgi:hypothetical protein
MADSSYNESEVGYKRPPPQSRFKPGVSGNPRGRQKGVRNFDADLKRSLEIPVTLSENGRTKKVSTQEALLLRLREKALKGDARAPERLLALALTHNTERLANPRDGELASGDDQAILDAFLEEAASRRTPLQSPSKIEIGGALHDEDQRS